MTNDITPFRINVPDSAIKALKDRLALSTFPDEVDFSNDWGYGAPLGDVKRLAKRWEQGFDWRAQEAKLNELPQFTTKIAADGFDELDIHFIHQKSQRPGSIPFLFVHGWPGHFLEVAKILPLLTNSEDGPSFHVVAPSLPNFGFSGVVKKKGFSIPQYAETMHKLMLKLGYDKYVTQGGDWGFIITRLIGVQYPESCLASHVNYVRTTEAPSFAKSPYLALKHSVVPYDESEKAGLERTQWFQKEGFGYNVEQSTKPSTLGFALADSPVALLAWIYEKLHDWTDNYDWTDDEILTWVSIYQFSTAGPAASIRIYYESKHAELERVQKGFEYVPNVHLGLSYFPKDLVVPPRTWGQTLGPVVSESVHTDGGHFAAHERPEQLVSDIKKMFQKDGGAYSVTQQFLSK